MKTKKMSEIREQLLDFLEDKEVILFAANKVSDEDLVKRELPSFSDEERSCLVMSKVESTHFLLQLGVVLATDRKTRAKLEQAIELSYAIPSSKILISVRPDGSIEIKATAGEGGEDENKDNNSNIQ